MQASLRLWSWYIVVSDATNGQADDNTLIAAGHKSGAVTVINIISNKIVYSFRSKICNDNEQFITHTPIHNVPYLIDHSMNVRSLCLSQSKVLFSGSDDKTIMSYDLRVHDLSAIKPYSDHSGWVTGVDISPIGDYLFSW